MSNIDIIFDIPKYNNKKTIANIKAAVEKLDGKIKIKTAPTGIQIWITESLNVYLVSLIFVSVRATYTIKIAKASVEG